MMQERIITESPCIGKRETFDVPVEGLILAKNRDSSPTAQREGKVRDTDAGTWVDVTAQARGSLC